jgi:hypothetical protein
VNFRQPSALPRPAALRWMVRHKIVTSIGALVVVALIGSTIDTSPSHSTRAATGAQSSSSATATTATSASPTRSGQQAAAVIAQAAKKKLAAASRSAAAKAVASKSAAAKAAAARAAAASAATASQAAAAKAAAASRAADASRAAEASKAAAQTPPPGASATDCTPGYDPCIPPGPDVDCAGGSGNGPRYVQGPVTVTGTDPYGLDHDHNGIGCEN